MAQELDSSAEYTLKILQDRLDAAEIESNRLSKSLKTFGFKADLKGTSKNRDIESGHRSTETGGREINRSPRTRLAGVEEERETARRTASYGDVVSRVDQLESTLQSLHTCVGDIRAEGHKLKERQSAEARNANETVLSNLEQLSTEYAKSKNEIRKLNTRNTQLKKKNKRAEEALLEKENELIKVKEENIQLSSNSNKLKHSLDEIGYTLSQESKLRTALEQSQESNLERTKELEENLETEKNNVLSLQGDIKLLQKELVLAKDALLHEQDDRLKLQNVLSQHGLDAERVTVEFNELLRQKKALQKELEKRRKENTALQEQIGVINGSFSDIKKAYTKTSEENAKLQETLRMAATDNKALISQQRELVQRERDKVMLKMQEQDKALGDAKQAVLNELVHQKAEFENITRANSEKEKKIEELEKELRDKRKEINGMETREKELVEKLRDQLAEVTKDKDQVATKMESEMTKLKEQLALSQKEKENTYTSLKELEIEKERIIANLNQCKEENQSLKEQLMKAEQKKMSQIHIERVVTELADSKNKLAYEKGALESEVDQLKVNLMALSGASEENNLLRQDNTALQSQYNKVLSELQNLRRERQQMELEIKKVHAVVDAKDREMRSLITSREEALQETRKLITHVELAEKRYTDKVAALESSLQNALKDNRKLVADLDGVASSHSHVQGVIEQLQTELGRKDNRIQMLDSDRLSSHHSVQQMQAEMGSLQEKLDSLKTSESEEVSKLKKELAKSKKDGKRCLENYKVLQKEKDEFQSILKDLSAEKGKIEDKIYLIKKESSEKTKKLESEKMEIKERATREEQKLKTLLTNKEKELNEMRSKHQMLKQVTETLESNQVVLEEKKLADLEKVNTFMSEVKELQSEIAVLAKSRDDAVERVRLKENQIEDEISRRIDVEDKCKDLEQRLFEASKQNEKISSTLRESEGWFKRKVAKLEREMIASRGEKHALEQSAYEQQMLFAEEREKSHMATENAKQLLRASRVAVNRLASKVSENNLETKGLKYLVDKENNQAIRAVQKYEKLLEASTRRVEELAKELDKAHDKARRKK